MPKKYNNLILSGGGVRGLYYLGFMKFFNNNMGSFKNLVGTSIGSFFVVAISLGYEYEELMPHVINILDYSKIKNMNLFEFLDNLGLDDGIKLEHYIKKMIRSKIGRKDITFKELYDIYEKNVTLTVVCLERKEVVYLSKDTHPYMKIWKAIRMSMGLPFLFKPFLYKEKHYLDGGIKHNFPIDLYNTNDTLGIDLSRQIRNNNGMNFEEFLFSLIDVVTRHKRQITNQDVINLDSCYNPNNPLLSFQLNVDNDIVLEAIEYSHEKIKEYFNNMNNDIDILCKSIVFDIIDKVCSV
jgi:predicted acylesterase/phospholipase RssA